MLEDEAHTADRLRTGEVLAAVTSVSEPVQGCKTIPLGELTYLACASPGYMRRYFKGGVTASSLAQSPYLRFDRRDQLQTRWVKKIKGAELSGLVHWVPSTFGFLDFALAGIAWGLLPEQLARSHIQAGRLVELKPGHSLRVKLFWTVARIHASSLEVLTKAVIKAAKSGLST